MASIPTMTFSMQYSHRRYTQYVEAEYVLQSTKSRKRAVKEPEYSVKLMKLDQDEPIEQQESTREHWCLLYSNKRIKAAHPSRRCLPEQANLQRNARERMDEKIAELTWAQVAATSQLQAEHQQRLQTAALAYDQLNGEYEQAKLQIQKAKETIRAGNAYWDEAKIEHHSTVSRMIGEAQDRDKTILNLQSQSESYDRKLQKYETEVESQHDIIAKLSAALENERKAKQNAVNEAADLKAERDALQGKVADQNMELEKMQSQNAETERAVASVYAIAYPEDTPDQDVDMSDVASSAVVDQCEKIADKLEMLNDTKAWLDEQLRNSQREIKELGKSEHGGRAAPPCNYNVGDVEMSTRVPYPTPERSRVDGRISPPATTPATPSALSYALPGTNPFATCPNPLFSSTPEPAESADKETFEERVRESLAKEQRSLYERLRSRSKIHDAGVKATSAFNKSIASSSRDGVNKTRSHSHGSTKFTKSNRIALQNIFEHGDLPKFRVFREPAATAKQVDEEAEDDEVDGVEERRQAINHAEEDDMVDPEDWVQQDRKYDQLKRLYDDHRCAEDNDHCAAAIASGLSGTVWWNGERTSMLYFSNHYKKEHMVMAELKTTDGGLASSANPYLPYVPEDIQAENVEDEIVDLETGDGADNTYGFSLQCALVHVPDVHFEALLRVQGSDKPISEDDLKRFRVRLTKERCLIAEDHDQHDEDWGKARDRAAKKLAGLSQFREACSAWANEEPSSGKWCWPPTFTCPMVAQKTSITAEGDRQKADLEAFCNGLTDGLDIEKSITRNDDDDMSELTKELTTISHGEDVSKAKRSDRRGVEGMFGPSKE